MDQRENETTEDRVGEGQGGIGCCNTFTDLQVCMCMCMTVYA